MDEEELIAACKSIRSATDLKKFLESKNYPHQYDPVTDTFKMDFRVFSVQGAPSTEDDDEEVHEAVKEAFGTRPGSNEDFYPTDDEFKQILAMTNRKNYRREDFKVYYLTSAGTALDRHFEKFSPKALDTMAKTSIGTPFMKDHDHWASDAVIGRVFDARVLRMKSGGKKLCQKVYIRNSPEMKSVIEGIEDGTNTKLSVGVRMKRKSLICDLCSKPVWSMSEGSCGHWPGSETRDGKVCTATIEDVVEQVETSRVSIGAQPIGAIKSASEDERAALNEEVPEAKSQAKNRATTIPALNITGDTSVDEDEKNKGQEKPAEKPADDAPPVAKPAADTTTKAEDKPTEKPADKPAASHGASEDLLKTLNDLKSEASEIKAKVDEARSQMDSLNKTIGEFKSVVEDLKTATSARIEANDKALDDVKKVMQVAAKAVQNIAQRVDAVQQKSVQDMVRELASVRHADKSRLQTAADKKEGENFYNSFPEQFS